MAVGVGARKKKDVVGVLSLGGPDFLSVDDPFVAVEGRRRLQARQIGSGIGFGESLTPRNGAIQDAGDELLLLFVGTPLKNGGAYQGVAEEVRAHGRVGFGELFVEHYLLHQGETLTAVLNGPAGADPPSGEELRGPGLVEALALVFVIEKPGSNQPWAGSLPARCEFLCETTRLQGDMSDP